MLTCCFVSKAYVTGWYSASVHLDNGKTLIQQLLQECQDHQHGALKRPEIHLPSFAECIEGALGLWLVAVVLCRSMVMARFSLSPPASASGGRCSSAWQAGSSNEALRALTNMATGLWPFSVSVDGKIPSWLSSWWTPALENHFPWYWDFRPQVCLQAKMNSWSILWKVSAGGICQLIFCVSSRSPVWQQHTGDSTDARYLTCIMKPGQMRQQLPSVRVVHVVYFIDVPASISCLYFAICCDDKMFSMCYAGPSSITDASWIESSHGQGIVFLI